MVTQTAYAKLNLALHIRRRREDGYHELETLFAFVEGGDRLSARPAASDELRTTGEFAPALTDPFNNIVARALATLPRGGPASKGGLAVTLEKVLPVAAGLGGGSADAGALFRIVRDLHGLPDDWQARAAKLGADVPACVLSETCIGRGTGTELEPIANDLAGAPVLLLNPRIPLATGPVFAAWDGVDRGPLPAGPPSVIAREGRNDLEAPAIASVPEIGGVLAALTASGAWLSRMSGSGASCFGLFADEAELDHAAAQIARDHSSWWQMPGRLR